MTFCREYSGVSGPDSIVLIRRAKEGDKDAWVTLCERYYPEWCRRFHGEIGPRLRRLYETRDMVDSALGTALRDIGDLRNEAAFFSWVSAIIQRKIASTHRREKRGQVVSLEAVPEPAKEGAWTEPAAFTEEDYLKILDTLLEAFPRYPEAMAAVYLKYFANADLAILESFFGKSDRSVQRLVREGMDILRAKLVVRQG